jgi:ABC-2 type transport system ATP-binding protein
MTFRTASWVCSRFHYMIETVNVRKEYGDVIAVRDLTLTIKPGDIFGLIGPNGAGKSTTINMLASILEPTEGKVYLDGLDVEKNRTQVREIVGYMPDFFGMYDDLTVREYLAFFATAYRLRQPVRTRRIDDVLEVVGLHDKRDELIGRLSRGMRQRLCLGKTLVHDPKILLLDEPASGMDPKGRVEMRNLLRQLQRQGKTTLISSHILTELSDVCNAIGIMEKGRMIETGTVDEIRAKIRRLMRLIVEVLEGMSQAEKLLQDDDRVENIVIEGNRLSLTVRGDAKYAAALLERLIASGVRVSSVAREVENVEEIYMQICGHQVS